LRPFLKKYALAVAGWWYFSRMRYGGHVRPAGNMSLTIEKTRVAGSGALQIQSI